MTALLMQPHKYCQLILFCLYLKIFASASVYMYNSVCCSQTDNSSLDVPMSTVDETWNPPFSRGQDPTQGNQSATATGKWTGSAGYVNRPKWPAHWVHGSTYYTVIYIIYIYITVIITVNNLTPVIFFRDILLFTSTKQVMFSPEFVCLSVCMLATYTRQQSVLLVFPPDTISKRKLRQSDSTTFGGAVQIYKYISGNVHKGTRNK